MVKPVFDSMQCANACTQEYSGKTRAVQRDRESKNSVCIQTSYSWVGKPHVLEFLRGEPHAVHAFAETI